MLRATMFGNYGKIDKSGMGNFDVEGYYVWELRKYIEGFVLKQLVKNGLAIEDRTV